jgi:hypothetical protein
MLGGDIDKQKRVTLARRPSSFRSAIFIIRLCVEPRHLPALVYAGDHDD